MLHFIHLHNKYPTELFTPRQELLHYIHLRSKYPTDLKDTISNRTNRYAGFPAEEYFDNNNNVGLFKLRFTFNLWGKISIMLSNNLFSH